MMNRSTFRNSAQPMMQCSMHPRGPWVLALVRRVWGEEGSEFFFWGGEEERESILLGSLSSN